MVNGRNEIPIIEERITNHQISINKKRGTKNEVQPTNNERRITNNQLPNLKKEHRPSTNKERKTKNDLSTNEEQPSTN